LAARLLAEALAAPNPAGALPGIARAFGESLDTQARQPAGSPEGLQHPLEYAADILEKHGYEPSVAEGQITLRNCPFDALAQRYRDVVCTMNRAFIDGLLAGRKAHDVTTVYQPQAGQCCVTINSGTDASQHAR
jgi:predicted ArsR family transcriptional regulator